MFLKIGVQCAPMIIDAKLLLDSLPRPVLERCINSTPSLRGFLQGYVAEEHLRGELEETPGVSEVEKIPDRALEKGDFRLRYRGAFFRVELKSVLTDSVRADPIRGGFQGKVIIKNTDSKTVIIGGRKVRTTCLSRGGFDILAISTVCMDGKWKCKFIASKYLPSAVLGPSFIKGNFSIDTNSTPFLRDDILDALEDLG